MDEIFYITNIDARPWKKSPDIGAAIPLVLFFASVETMRKSFNVSSELPNLEKYCVMIVVVVLGMYLSKRCALPWRKAYTTKLFLDLIYLCLISTGIYNALRQLGFVRDWLVSAQNNAIGLLDNRIVDGATLMHLLFAAITSGSALSIFGLGHAPSDGVRSPNMASGGPIISSYTFKKGKAAPFA